GRRSRWSLAPPSATGTSRNAARSSPASAVPATPSVLRRTLGALRVTIDDAAADVGAVQVGSYGDEPRPHSVVRLTGGGALGRGEHVGWTGAARRRWRYLSLA